MVREFHANLEDKVFARGKWVTMTSISSTSSLEHLTMRKMIIQY